MTRQARHFRPHLSGPAYEFFRLLLPAIIVGVGSGLGAVAFRKLISFFTWLFFTKYAQLTVGFHPLNTITIPALGALLFGPMIWWWAREARGHGVPEVMEAVALRGGRIRPVVALVKSLASSINIGSGGSVGREGPIAQIGSALGSTLGQVLRLPPRYLRLLVAAGAAGGISATFNAPIAGALFAMEVILREFSAESFAAVGTAAVIADMVGLPFLGSKAFFVLPAGTGLHSPWELLFFAVLGVVGALVGTSFTRFLYWTEDLFKLWKFPEALKPAAGGLLLGVLILLVPQVRGLGYNIMALAFSQKLSLGILALYLVGKFVATSLTLGSGGSGGIFTPTLYMGAMVGGIFGTVASHAFPGLVGPAAGYALIGASAVFSSAARAPITSVVIVMEMSQNYVLAIPLILATLISTRVSDLALQDSIYTLKLVRRGVKLFQEKAVDLLQQVTVGEAMLKEVPVIRPDASLGAAASAMAQERIWAMPVVEEGRLRGLISVTDLELAREEVGKELTVADLMASDVVVAYPEEPLREAVRRMGRADVDQLPVVNPEDPSLLMGLLRRLDVVRALEKKVESMPGEDPSPSVDAPRPSTGAFQEFVLPTRSPHVRKQLKEAAFPSGMVVVAITRGHKTIVPRGDTVLMGDDNLLLYVIPAAAIPKAKVFVEEGELPSPVGTRSGTD